MKEIENPEFGYYNEENMQIIIKNIQKKWPEYINMAINQLDFSDTPFEHE